MPVTETKDRKGQEEFFPLSFGISIKLIVASHTTIRNYREVARFA